MNVQQDKGPIRLKKVKDKLNRKMNKRPKQTFHNGRNTVNVKYIARFSASLVIWKMQINP